MNTQYIIKRVKKELEWPKFWSMNDPYVDPIEEFNNKIRFIDFTDNHIYFVWIHDRSTIHDIDISENTLITIKMDKSFYPFSPPKQILINGTNYFEYLKLHYNSNRILNKITNKRCFCCSTLMCKNNWNPHKNLKDLLNEIMFTLTVKKRIVEIIHAEKIIDKYLIQDIPIIDYI